MECCSDCSCEESSSGASRREVLAAMTVAAIALPALTRHANADATAPAADGEGTWLKTVKAADLKDKSAKVIANDAHVTLAILTRDGQMVMALSPKCTHKGCTVKPAAGKLLLACPCHRAEFDFTGKNTAGPHRPSATEVAATLKPLSHFALRLNADGVIEVDNSHMVDAADKSAVLTLPA